MLDERLRRLVDRELGEIDALLARSHDMLVTTSDDEPSFERLAALSQILTSFYTGLERIFERIIRHVDYVLPEGERWHAELLSQVARSTPDRPSVISEEARILLRDYLAFRHRSHHAYAHYLEWRPMEHLVVQLSDTWHLVCAEIQRFLEEHGGNGLI